MKSIWKLVAITVFAVSAVFASACAAPAGDETAESEGAASEDDPKATTEDAIDYMSSPFLGGASIKQWVVRGATPASAEVAKLWISRDGAFTVEFPTSEPWNGSFKAESTTMTLKINNAGGDEKAATAPIAAAAWSYAASPDKKTITLSRAGSASIVLTAAL